MNEVVANIRHVFCYIDDIIVMTQNLAEHERILRTFMQALPKNGLELNSEKCVLAVRSSMFLSNCVTSNSVDPAEAKIRSIRSTELPRTKGQLRRYLGMYQFYKKLCEMAATFLLFGSFHSKQSAIVLERILETAF